MAVLPAKYVGRRDVESTTGYTPVVRTARGRALPPAFCFHCPNLVRDIHRNCPERHMDGTKLMAHSLGRLSAVQHEVQLVLTGPPHLVYARTPKCALNGHNPLHPHKFPLGFTDEDHAGLLGGGRHIVCGKCSLWNPGPFD